MTEAVDNLSEALQLYFEDNDAAAEILTIEETMIGETLLNV
jgi:predicted RNase H-like HicB family nuclease